MCRGYWSLNVSLKAKIEVLRKALAVYKLELAQAKLRTFADTRIAALDFGLLPGRHFVVHKFLVEKGWVKEVRVARSYNRLRDLKSDSLAFRIMPTSFVTKTIMRR